MKTVPKKWREIKAKIILRFGSITKCAHSIGCSNNAVRLAAEGKCPGVWARLEKALA